MSRRPEPIVHRADTAGDDFDSSIERCRAALAEHAEVDCVLHYTGGAYDYAVGHEPYATTDRALIERIGRQMVFQFDYLEPVLSRLRSGRLMRMVLHGERGAVFCNAVVPREHLVTVCRAEAAHPPVPIFSVSEVQAADRAAAELLNRLRRELSQPPQDHGGWAAAALAQGEVPAGGSPGEPHVSVARDVPERLFAAFSAAVDPRDLHYLALVRDGTSVLSVDRLDDRSLRRFFRQISVDSRRRQYGDLGRQLGYLGAQLGRLVRSVVGGAIERLVLDVQEGAVFFYRIRVGEYLVGVTLDQDAVAPADDKTARIAAAILGDSLGEQIEAGATDSVD